jgi:hypothetical protein
MLVKRVFAQSGQKCEFRILYLSGQSEASAWKINSRNYRWKIYMNEFNQSENRPIGSPIMFQASIKTYCTSP